MCERSKTLLIRVQLMVCLSVHGMDSDTYTHFIIAENDVVVVIVVVLTMNKIGYHTLR
jgi:hypothetical protein